MLFYTHLPLSSKEALLLAEISRGFYTLLLSFEMKRDTTTFLSTVDRRSLFLSFGSNASGSREYSKGTWLMMGP